MKGCFFVYIHYSVLRGFFFTLYGKDGICQGTGSQF